MNTKKYQSFEWNIDNPSTPLAFPTPFSITSSLPMPSHAITFIPVPTYPSHARRNGNTYFFPLLPFFFVCCSCEYCWPIAWTIIPTHWDFVPGTSMLICPSATDWTAEGTVAGRGVGSGMVALRGVEICIPAQIFRARAWKISNQLSPRSVCDSWNTLAVTPDLSSPNPFYVV